MADEAFPIEHRGMARPPVAVLRVSDRPRVRLLSLLTISLGFFLIQLDATIVNVALPSMQHDVDGSLSALQWVVDAYTLALSAIMLTAGAAADRFGPRRAFLVGLACFGGGSALAAGAPGLGVLIGARALQGLGGAALLPSSLALLARQYPSSRARAHALGVWGGMGSLGMAVGPLVGGALVAAAGWRSIFALNVPVCAAVAIMVWFRVATPGGGGTRRTDIGGTLLGVLAIAGICATCISWGQRGFSSAWTTVPLLIGAAAAVAFWQVEQRLENPMLPLRIFRNPGFSAAVVLGILFNLCAYGALLCLSLYLQHQAGLPSLAAGLALLPFTAIVGAGSVASGRLTAWLGPRRPMVAGMVCALLGVLVMAAAAAAGSLPFLLTGSLLFGCCSLAMPAMTAVALGALGPGDAGVAGGVLNAARQGGGALGVALLGAVLARTQQSTGELVLTAPLLVAAAGYGTAVGAAWVAGRRSEEGAPAAGAVTER